MYPVSNNFKQYCKKHIRGKKLMTISSGAITITPNEIKKVKINCEAYSDYQIIGRCASKEIDIDLIGTNYDLTGKELVVNTTMIYNDGTTEDLPMGNYIIDRSSTSSAKDSQSFKGYDYMCKFDVLYDGSMIVYPCTMETILNKCCEIAGVQRITQNIVNGSLNVTGDYFTSGQTCREVLSYICQVAGAYGIITRDNKLKLIYLGDGAKINSEYTFVEELTPDYYLDDFEVKTTYGPVNSIHIGFEGVDGDTTIDDTSSQQQYGIQTITIKDNLFLGTQSQREYAIQNLWNSLKDTIYKPFSCTYLGFPYLDSGDLLKITNDNSYPTMLFNYTFEYDGGYMGTLKTPTITKTQEVYEQTNTLQNKFKQLGINIDYANGKIESVVETVDEQNEKISTIEQTVDEINQKIGEITDITVTDESTIAHCSLDDINESQPIHIEIHPIIENISYLYPNLNLFPSSTTFLKTRTLRFENTTTNEIFNWVLPTNLWYYDATNYDTLILDYDSYNVVVNRKCIIDSSGSVSLLSTPTTETYPFPTVEELSLTSGDYDVYLVGYSTGYLKVRLMASNIYTTQFATRVELNSAITQTSSEINLEVSRRIIGFDANGNRTDDVISSINLAPGTVTINADKVNINGVINAINNNTTTTINGNKITTGTITAEQIEASAITAEKLNITTLSSISSNLGSITGGSININGYFSVNSSGGTQLSTSGGGFLTTRTTTHPYVSALNVARGSGGIAFGTGTSQSSFGSTKASIGLAYDGNVNDYVLRIDPGATLNIGGHTGQSLEVIYKNSEGQNRYLIFYKGILVGWN